MSRNNRNYEIAPRKVWETGFFNKGMKEALKICQEIKKEFPPVEVGVRKKREQQRAEAVGIQRCIDAISEGLKTDPTLGGRPRGSKNRPGVGGAESRKARLLRLGMDAQNSETPWLNKNK